MILPKWLLGQQGLFPSRQRQKLSFLDDKCSLSPSTKCFLEVRTSEVFCIPHITNPNLVSHYQLLSWYNLPNSKIKLLQVWNVQMFNRTNLNSTMFQKAREKRIHFFFCSINLCVWFYISTTLPWSLQIRNITWNVELWFLQCAFFFF